MLNFHIRKWKHLIAASGLNTCNAYVLMSNWLSRSTVVNFRFWVKSESRPYRDQVKDAGTWRKLTDYFVKCGWDSLYFVMSSFTFHVYVYHIFANSVHIRYLFVVYTNDFDSIERDKVNFYVDLFRWKDLYFFKTCTFNELPIQ